MEIILLKSNREVGEFMMNCFGMVIVYHYEFSQKAWRYFVTKVGK